MVSREQIRVSNSRVGTSLRPGLVAVFAGATSGIGETSLIQFAKVAVRPRIYFLGRSKASGDRVRDELDKVNSEGEYIYISVDVSLLKSVDNVCHEIKSKEETINLLFLTTGTMVTGKDTDEGLNYPAAVTFYARMRFIVNLLPLVRKATDLRRVVTVFAATKEGPVDTGDLQSDNVPLLSQRGHFSSMMTLALEAIAEEAPDVSFIHDFPGSVKTNLGKEVKSATMMVMKAVFKVIGPFVFLAFDEAGERQVFFSTSARFPPRARGNEDADAAAVGVGVPLPPTVGVARGTDGNTGSGVYSINIDGESAPPKVEQRLAKMRGDGTLQKVWAHVEEEFVRITGAVSMSV
ncbi:Oxidoreductase [Exophiala dermatitidis]